MDTQMQMTEVQSKQTCYQGISDLTFRRIRNDDDFEVITDLINRSWAADGLDGIITVEEIRNYYTHLDGFDLDEDLKLAEVAGQPVGLAQARWYLDMSGDWLYYHREAQLPEWRLPEISRALLLHNERRLREIAAQQAAEGQWVEGRRFLEAYAAGQVAGKIALLESEGYSPVRYMVEMVCPDLEIISDAPLPAGLEVRPIHPEHYHSIWLAIAEAFRDHWSVKSFTDEDYQGWLSNPDFDPTLCQVAWERDQVAGVVLCAISEAENTAFNRQRAWLSSICTRRPWRRRGLAYNLISRSMRKAQERGMQEAALQVDAENLSGALGLYERAGFKATRRDTVYRKPL